MKQIHIYISGFVQGVGFRMYVKKNAKKLGLTGWVQNLPDRRVEALIQGEEHKLQKMIQLCEKGSYFSEVKDVAVEWHEIEKHFEEFVINR